MKRLITILGLVFLSACAAPQEIIQPTNTPVPSTATPAPTNTQLPSPTPTPTPEPYLLEDGVLQDWDEEAEDYQVVAEEIDALTITTDGATIALDGRGLPRFVFVEDTWVEIQIPEGAESHEELTVPDRYVSVVNENGKVEEVLESGTKVLVNPETEKYEYEFKYGQWVEYEPRVMVVGEVAAEGHPKGYTEVPKEVLETAVETMRNAIMFTRDGVELKTGYDEVLGEHKFDGLTYISWYGVLCGATESNIANAGSPMVAGFMGVEMNSGDVMLVTVMFARSGVDLSYIGRVFEEEEVSSSLDSMRRLYLHYGERAINRTELAEIILNTPIGTPFYVATKKTSVGDELQRELNIGVRALKTGELENEGGVSIWRYLDFGASEEFWDDAIDR